MLSGHFAPQNIYEAVTITLEHTFQFGDDKTDSTASVPVAADPTQGNQ